MRKDPWKILRIKPNSSPEEIKRAYRRQAKKWHPDVNKSKKASGKMKDINWAYRTLRGERDFVPDDDFIDIKAELSPFPEIISEETVVKILKNNKPDDVEISDSEAIITSYDNIKIQRKLYRVSFWFMEGDGNELALTNKDDVIGIYKFVGSWFRLSNIDWDAVR